MATSIFFTESKDFKLLKEQILNQEDYFLVYVYADTSNVRIPKDMIRDLPIYGNNLVWVDTANMDSAMMANHMVLTIGQLLNPEEEISFYVVSKTQKFEKMILFLRNQGIPAEWIGGEPTPVTKTASKGKKRGRPKKVRTETELAEEIKPARKRGRPRKSESQAEQVIVEAAPKKRGRKPKEDSKKGTGSKKQAKAKTKSTRTVKEFSEDEVKAKISALGQMDYNAEQFLVNLLKLPKIRRPKLIEKMVDLIKLKTSEDDLQAKEMINGFIDLNLITINPTTGKINYKD